MKNPIINKKHLTEYVVYGFVAALLYCILLFFHLKRGDYESSYLLYIGNGLFGAVILIYNMTLLNRPYDRQRAASMMIAGHLATLAGTILSIIFCIVLMFILNPSNAGLENAPSTTQMERPSGWLFMVFANALILNFGIGSLISVVTSYAGKKNQTKDKPAHLGKHVSNERTTNDA